MARWHIGKGRLDLPDKQINPKKTSRWKLLHQAIIKRIIFLDGSPRIREEQGTITRWDETGNNGVVGVTGANSSNSEGPCFIFHLPTKRQLILHASSLMLHFFSLSFLSVLHAFFSIFHCISLRYCLPPAKDAITGRIYAILLNELPSYPLGMLVFYPRRMNLCFPPRSREIFLRNVRKFFVSIHVISDHKRFRLW